MDFERIIEQYSSGNLSLSDVGLLVVFYLLIRFLEWGAVNSWKAWNKSKLPNSHDLDVWKKITNRLSHNNIDYWREHNVCDAFPERLFNELDNFIQEFKCSSPQKKFLDKKLEKLRNILVKKVSQFLESISDVGTDKYGTTLKIRRDYSTGEFPAAQKDLKSKAEQMITAYDKLTELVIKKISNKKVAADG